MMSNRSMRSCVGRRNNESRWPKASRSQSETSCRSALYLAYCTSKGFDSWARKADGDEASWSKQRADA
eukprot:6198109-Pleurochrysis_carterae.AAC.2